MQVEKKINFLMYTLIVQKEEEYQQLAEIEKEEAVVITAYWKEITQLIKGFDRIQLHNRKRRQISICTTEREDRYIDKERGIISKQRRKRQ